MEILHAESKELHRLKGSDEPTNTSSASSTIDDGDVDDDDDRLSQSSNNDEKQSNEKLHDSNKTSIDQSEFSISSLHHRTTSTTDYPCHRDRLVKELKDYEDRWLAQRNFLLYSQSLALKGEERDRLFSQLNSVNTNHLQEDNSSLHQLQFQQQLLHRLSKEERDRFFAAALYQQPATNPYHFHPYPWNNSSILAQIQSSSLSTGVAGVATATGATESQQHGQPKSPSSDDSGTQSNSGSTTEWTFEEQFRQLYELSDEPKRKEFLDDLFAFMQKRGTPVNRIPIMAKHVLDLYELFRLVVGKGGLVEVINKKLWREVTKGLNLPSSITSAAFTLRTQYMKYLYPYECEKLQLSSPNELQAAIEGNRREGRRPSYAFEYSSPPQIMPPPPPPPTTAAPPATTAASSNVFLNSPMAHRSLDQNHAAMAAALSHPFFLAAAAASSRDLSESLSNTSRMASSSGLDESHAAHQLLSSPSIKRSISPSSFSKAAEECAKKFSSPINNPNLMRSNSFTPTLNPSLLSQVSKLKIIAKENNPEQSPSMEKSITLAIELNGIAYQGTLYATSLTGSKD